MNTQPYRRRNVAKLLARLNPKSMPLSFSGPGSTAIDVETSLDIAGALGAAARGQPIYRLAVIALCLRWWPGMFEAPTRTISHTAVRRSYTARVAGEMTQKTYIEQMPVEVAGETPAFKSIAGMVATQLERSVTRSKNDASMPVELWTRVTAAQFLGAWSRLVIHEYRFPHHCPTCTPFGRVGEVPKMEHSDNGKSVSICWWPCTTCTGQGLMSWSVKRRSKAMKISEHPWRANLNLHHEHALSVLRELEWRGARRVVKQLGD